MMTRWISATIVLLVGTSAGLVTSCGRFGFDAHDGSASSLPPDAAMDAATAPPMDTGPDFTAGCAVLLHMDETAWINRSGSGSAAPGATDVVNACDGGNPGQALGNPQPTTDSIRGTVGDFNASSCIQLTRDTPARADTAVTTSAWLRMTGDPANSFGVVAKRVDVNNDNEYAMFVWTDSHVFADIDGIGDRFSGVAVIPTGIWTQITMVYDGSLPQDQRTRIYVNGVLDKVGGDTSALISQAASGAPLSVGCLPLGGIAQSFVGQLDDIGVWTRAFSDADVDAWYQLTRK
jgi:hypothetical protein